VTEPEGPSPSDCLSTLVGMLLLDRLIAVGGMLLCLSWVKCQCLSVGDSCLVRVVIPGSNIVTCVGLSVS
jgi:hypothetical protein